MHATRVEPRSSGSLKMPPDLIEVSSFAFQSSNQEFSFRIVGFEKRGQLQAIPSNIVVSTHNRIHNRLTHPPAW
ncbi:MAG: hypothetical protein NT013_31270 [Planctomycetia bacterium]|nr:hypothetical protein [Planctomycetia bacterium]